MLTVQTLTGRYAELGQIGIVAHWRGDVQLDRPRAFAAWTASRTAEWPAAGSDPYEGMGAPLVAVAEANAAAFEEAWRELADSLGQ
jgi:hypothetical protein